MSFVSLQVVSRYTSAYKSNVQYRARRGGVAVFK